MLEVAEPEVPTQCCITGPEKTKPQSAKCKTLYSFSGFSQVLRLVDNDDAQFALELCNMCSARPTDRPHAVQVTLFQSR